MAEELRLQGVLFLQAPGKEWGSNGQAMGKRWFTDARWSDNLAMVEQFASSGEAIVNQYKQMSCCLTASRQVQKKSCMCFPRHLLELWEQHNALLAGISSCLQLCRHHQRRLLLLPCIRQQHLMLLPCWRGSILLALAPHARNLLCA